MSKKIVQKEASVLREISKEVPVGTITSPKIQKILSEMKVALASQDDGVAIAAPQIGYALRIFVVSGKIPELIKKAVIAEDGKTDETTKQQDSVFINPVIKKISKERKIVEEGCLSVRYLYGQVSRSKKATVEAYNEYGEKFTRGATGLLAQIFQHEIDHLNGILFIDNAKYVEEILPDTIRK
jgi:peptide deformylase